MTREEGVEAFAWVSLNSGSLGRFSSIAFGFRVTISSRHWGGVLAGLRGLWSFVGPVGVIIVSWDCGGWFSGEGGDGFEGVDGEGVEEFVGDYEGAFVFFCCFWDVLVDDLFFWLI